MKLSADLTRRAFLRNTAVTAAAVAFPAGVFACSEDRMKGALRLHEVRIIDEEHIMVVIRDGWVTYQDDGKGPEAFQGVHKGADILEVFGAPLDVGAAKQPSNFVIRSPLDPTYRAGVNPIECFRKSKVSGTAWDWPEPRIAIEHTLFLRLPRPLQKDTTYTLELGEALRSDREQAEFSTRWDEVVSEALHVNLIGYNPAHTQAKSADLYMWLGDGGPRDYSQYVGRPVILKNVKTGREETVGTVQFWKPSGPDLGNWNLTRSPVWNCDFSGFTKEGTYRLVVDGIGSSPIFELRRDVYRKPFETSTRGFYYMRIGEPKTLVPPPRQPRFLPGKDPEGFRVYLTTFGPWHPDWRNVPGDPWDLRDWSQYRLPGNPTNPNAFGGHSDALDWDRHIGHISIIWDLLLSYIITNGKGGEDNLGILESGNGIPDVIDEAQNEVDLWLRLRDQEGNYATGLGNPSQDNTVMYQAQTRPFAAWASAANCAMLAEAFRIAGKMDAMARYRDASLEAWDKANDQDLDERHHIGNGAVRGRDLKQMAAAFLYNVTGERRFEDVMAAESVIKSPTDPTERANEFNQLWGTAAYLTCRKYGVRPIRHPELARNMQAAVLNEAREKNLANSVTWPSRRCADTAHGWFQSVIEVQRVCVAHAVADSEADRRDLLRALILEADYSLGRNPLNSVLMTGLGSRHVDDIYTSGQNDGHPGVHPGHTPYMNAEPWGTGFMFDPKWMAARGYPAWEQWPQGEALWRARYCFANNEFTPQQTMRGKHVLYAYLHSLGR